MVMYQFGCQYQKWLPELFMNEILIQNNFRTCELQTEYIQIMEEKRQQQQFASFFNMPSIIT